MKRLRITVGGKAYDVTVEVLGEEGAGRPQAAPVTHTAAPVLPAASAPTPAAPPPPIAAPRQTGAAGAVTSPMAGTVKSVQVKVGDAVRAGQVVVVLDAMKMEVPVSAPQGGTVASVAVNDGQSVQEGQVLLVVE